MSVLLTGGRIIDPSSGTDRVGDVLCVDGDIAAVEDMLPLPGRHVDTPVPFGVRVIDCAGMVVTPGLIDLHCHVMPGLGDFCVDADRIGIGLGVPVLVDGGTSGVATFDLARAAVIDHPGTVTDVLAFIDPNQLYLATTDYLCHRLELANDVRNIDLESLSASLERNSDVVVGLKVRACSAGDPERSPFLEAAQAASNGKPVMVHLGRFPHTPTITTPRLLDALRPGDIVTHAFRAGGGLLDAGGRPIPEFVDAVGRGVRLDVGHSGTDFRFREARRLFDLGYLPDTISTDLNVFNIDGPVRSLTETMTKILALGVDLVNVISMCTSAAAAVIGRSDGYGSLEVGRRADISVIAVEDEPHDVSDGHETITAQRWVRPVGCVASGKWYLARDLRTLEAA